MKILDTYKNGNANIMLFDDGTRVIEYPDGEHLNVDFPLSMDCKITNQCPMGCPMCHEKSTPNGEHGDIMTAEFINKLHKGTEMAIGGGAVTSHPHLVPFLEKLKELGVRPSITVHQKEFENNEKLINYLIENKLIYGLGVSFSSKNDKLWLKILRYKNSVVHLINGIHGKEVFDYFAYNKAKILILGYKDFGRGHDFLNTEMGKIIEEKMTWLNQNLKNYIDKFEVVSFDNLAIKQLDVKSILSEKEWNEFYQGDDGTATMYVDLVKKQFAKTSTSSDRFSLLDNIEDMFNVIKYKENEHGKIQKL